MAWVTQHFEVQGFKVSLLGDRVEIEVQDPTLGACKIFFKPLTQSGAHGGAMMLRRAARRLEEIGKDLQ